MDATKLLERKLAAFQGEKKRIRKSIVAQLQIISRVAMDGVEQEGEGLPSISFLVSHIDYLHELRAEFGRLDHTCQALRSSLRDLGGAA